MLLNIERSGEQDLECSEEWLVKTDPGNYKATTRLPCHAEEGAYCIMKSRESSNHGRLINPFVSKPSVS